ncbi:phosphoribosylformylglycinamidine synthase subunit PurQ [candidate division KSB3 bacterium]|uniref:Phosphoribosylformylglycinamidine synthase subunit PurQ n=1 Tax=candidate division KSB3 bacterium TaxID=2044937 RepID=A0A9D5JWX0_9BACT|nr:phosphoribosylformylglycinamidine synthase subunit PurQ [candidate division KSB3 bacterium]MBD3325226.1 phosphoribosylformylglycinamidine synthase subunit PurQ [candidate division KSB3 bacterium]
MKPVKSLIITGFGINCEEEMAAAYRLAGADATIVHLNDILIEGFSIHRFDILNFPGGFSFGDDIASGKVLANKLRYRKLVSGKTFIDEIIQFLEQKKYILGVCNGFQVLVKMGLLPNISGNLEQEVTLTRNDSGKFEDRWCNCQVAPSPKTPFLQGIDQLSLPVRNGEGKLIVKDDGVRQAILEYGLNCLSYTDAEGHPTEAYPCNPSGAELNCAGLTDPTGQILGLMPHPEAHLSLYNHPNWGRLKRQNPAISEEGAGLQVFKNIVTHLAQQAGAAH